MPMKSFPKSESIRIGIDFDGVLVDCTELKKEMAQHMYGVDIGSTICKEHAVVREGLLTREQYRALMSQVCGNPNIGLRMRAMDGGVEHLKRLLDSGQSLKIITARADDDLEVAKEWCRINQLDIDFVSVGYRGSKVEAARGLHVYLDDDLDKLLPLQGIVPHLFLFSWPHNAQEQTPGSIMRISSWDEFVAIVNEIERAYA